MANVTGTYTTGLKDENGVDLGLQFVETAYLTAIKSNMVPNYILPDAQVSKFYFKSGATTYNLDDIYVRADFWRQGNLLNWGRNSTGQLGAHDIVHRSSPVQTCAGGNNWNACSAGYNHMSGVKSDGTLWLWGRNTDGRLGDNTITHRSSPVQTVSGGTNWQMVALGYAHSAGIKTDGTLWTWGLNSSGQLGDNTITHRSSPVQTVSGGTDWKQVSCGKETTGAIKTDNTLWMWGQNVWGALGDNTRTARSSPVQTVSGGAVWKQVACGYLFSGAIKTDGTLWTWGYNTYGSLGDNTISFRSSPVQTVSAGTDWKFLAAGMSALAIKTDGSLWGWGKNDLGQLGNNTATNRSSPVQTISAGNNWSKVAIGMGLASVSAAIKTDGTLWTWGYNLLGQVGDNTRTTRSSPVQTVLGGTAWRSISCCYSNAVALNYLDFPAGTIPDPPPGPTPTPAPAPCWVARVVYGETNPRWMVFRDWLLQDAHPWLRKTYLTYGERFAGFISNKPLMKRIVKSMMDIIVNKRYKD